MNFFFQVKHSFKQNNYRNLAINNYFKVNTILSDLGPDLSLISINI